MIYQVLTAASTPVGPPPTEIKCKSFLRSSSDCGRFADSNWSIILDLILIESNDIFIEIF